MNPHKTMTLEELGYTAELETYRINHSLDDFAIGRVIAEHRERYVVKTPEEEYDAEILGNLRYSAQSRSDFPAVGDWVAISVYDEDKALIHAVLPRRSIIERQAVGKKGEKQVIASNIDFAFIIQAADRDFSLNRIERYLAICHTAGVEPIVILNKTDLADETSLAGMTASLQKRLKDIPFFSVSNASGEGIDQLKETIIPGKTYCLLGSSGVGKSTLLNTLLGREWMKTGVISPHTERGRHITTHRELRVLESGGIFIDNPGMREVGVADAAGGLEITFDTIAGLSRFCKFKDCSHTTETGCAVLAALEKGDLDPSAYENYLKLEREKAHFESTVADKRRRDKQFGKLMKNFKKDNYKKR